jgi:Family of unknown function (DUF5681)
MAAFLGFFPRRRESLRTVKRTVNPRSLKNLRPWKKGESGNPGGRPKRPVTEAYEEQLYRVKPGDRLKRTYAKLIAEAQIRKALRGSTMAAKEITDRVEGKARQTFDVALEGPVEFNLEIRFVDSDGDGRLASPNQEQ